MPCRWWKSVVLETPRKAQEPRALPLGCCRPEQSCQRCASSRPFQLLTIGESNSLCQVLSGGYLSVTDSQNHEDCKKITRISTYKRIVGVNRRFFKPDHAL